MSDLSNLSDADLTALYMRVKAPFESALAAEGVTGELANLARSIYAQESGSGKNTKTSNAGAVGGMQIRPSTFDEVADKGWNIKDPFDNARAGIRYLAKMFDKSGGDPELAAAGYYGGPGAVEKAKAGIAVADPRNPDAPDTLQYGKQVAERMKKGVVANALDKVTDAVIPSAQAADTPYSKMSDADLIAAYNAAKGNGRPAEQPRQVDDGHTRVMGVDLTALPGQAAHAFGNFGRDVVNVATAPLAIASDAITGPINAGLDAIAGKGNGFRFQRAADALNNVMDAAGVAKPENGLERVVNDMATGVGGVLTTAGVGGALAKSSNPVASEVGKILASGPGLQATSAAAGAAASGITRENGGSEGAQIAAGIAGSLAPSLVPTATKAAIRGVLRGGEEGRLAAERNLAAFEAAGTTPTLGQATGGRVAQAIESWLAKAPGGAGVIAKNAQRQTDEIAASVQRFADELAPNSNATNAGEAIERGVSKYKDASKLVQQQLYAKLDKYIPENTPITSEKTAAALADLNADIEGAPALSAWFKNAKIRGIESALRSDTESIDAVLTRPGVQAQAEKLRSQLEQTAAQTAALNAERRVLGMPNMAPVMTPEEISQKVTDFLSQQVDSRLPYESVKKLRTLVGRELADNSIVSDVPRSKWVALYSALSDDLGVAARNAGKEASTAWERANLFTSRFMNRLETLKGVVSKDTPEKVFNAAISGSAEGATTINRVINVLPENERREVAAAVLQRMGRATSGQQNALGEAFSSETFLTNLSKFSPEARHAIFGRTGLDGIEDKLATFAKVAEIRREGGRVFANPSGTSAGVAQNVLGGGIAYGAARLLAGDPTPLALAAAAPVGANIAARMMTGEKAVSMAATRTPIAAGTQASMLEAATRASGTPTQGDQRLVPVSKRQPAQSQIPRVELTGMAPAATPSDVLNAKSVDEAIDAAVAVTKSKPIPSAPATQTESVVNQPEPPVVVEQPDPKAQKEAVARQEIKTSLGDAIVHRENGPISIKGDPATLKDILQRVGISAVPTRTGVLVGASQAKKAREIFGK